MERGDPQRGFPLMSKGRPVWRNGYLAASAPRAVPPGIDEDHKPPLPAERFPL
jgi:hypothetical protein